MDSVDIQESGKSPVASHHSNGQSVTNGTSEILTNGSSNGCHKQNGITTLNGNSSQTGEDEASHYSKVSPSHSVDGTVPQLVVKSSQSIHDDLVDTCDSELLIKLKAEKKVGDIITTAGGTIVLAPAALNVEEPSKQDALSIKASNLSQDNLPSDSDIPDLIPATQCMYRLTGIDEPDKVFVEILDSNSNNSDPAVDNPLNENGSSKQDQTLPPANEPFASTIDEQTSYSDVNAGHPPSSTNVSVTSEATPELSDVQAEKDETVSQFTESSNYSEKTDSLERKSQVLDVVNDFVAQSVAISKVIEELTEKYEDKNEADEETNLPEKVTEEEFKTLIENSNSIHTTDGSYNSDLPEVVECEVESPTVVKDLIAKSDDVTRVLEEIEENASDSKSSGSLVSDEGGKLDCTRITASSETKAETKSDENHFQIAETITGSEIQNSDPQNTIDEKIISEKSEPQAQSENTPIDSKEEKPCTTEAKDGNESETQESKSEDSAIKHVMEADTDVKDEVIEPVENTSLNKDMRETVITTAVSDALEETSNKVSDESSDQKRGSMDKSLVDKTVPDARASEDIITDVTDENDEQKHIPAAEDLVTKSDAVTNVLEEMNEETMNDGNEQENSYEAENLILTESPPDKEVGISEDVISDKSELDSLSCVGSSPSYSNAVVEELKAKHSEVTDNRNEVTTVPIVEDILSKSDAYTKDHNEINQNIVDNVHISENLVSTADAVPEIMEEGISEQVAEDGQIQEVLPLGRDLVENADSVIKISEEEEEEKVANDNRKQENMPELENFVSGAVTVANMLEEVSEEVSDSNKEDKVTVPVNLVAESDLISASRESNEGVTDNTVQQDIIPEVAELIEESQITSRVVEEAQTAVTETSSKENSEPQCVDLSEKADAAVTKQPEQICDVLHDNSIQDNRSKIDNLMDESDDINVQDAENQKATDNTKTLDIVLVAENLVYKSDAVTKVLKEISEEINENCIEDSRPVIDDSAIKSGSTSVPGEENKNIIEATEAPESVPGPEDLVTKSDSVITVLEGIPEEITESRKENSQSVIDDSVATSGSTSVSDEGNKDITEAIETTESVSVAEDLVAKSDSIPKVPEGISEEIVENSKESSQPVIDDSVTSSGSTSVPGEENENIIEATEAPESAAVAEDLVAKSDAVTKVLEGISEEITESRKEDSQPLIDDSVVTSGSTSVPVEENKDITEATEPSESVPVAEDLVTKSDAITKPLEEISEEITKNTEEESKPVSDDSLTISNYLSRPDEENKGVTEASGLSESVPVAADLIAKSNAVTKVLEEISEEITEISKESSQPVIDDSSAPSGSISVPYEENEDTIAANTETPKSVPMDENLVAKSDAVTKVLEEISGEIIANNQAESKPVIDSSLAASGCISRPDEEIKVITGATETLESVPVTEDLTAQSHAVTKVLEEISEEITESGKENSEPVIDESAAPSGFTSVTFEEVKKIMEHSETPVRVEVTEDSVPKSDTVTKELEEISEQVIKNSEEDNSVKRTMPVIDNSITTSSSISGPDEENEDIIEATETPKSVPVAEDLVDISDSGTKVLEELSEESNENKKEDSQPVIDESVAAIGSTSAPVEENINITGDTETSQSVLVGEDLVAKSVAVTKVLEEISEEITENIKKNIQPVIDDSVTISVSTSVSDEENKDITEATETSECAPVAEDLVPKSDSVTEALEEVSEENTGNNKENSQPVIGELVATSGSTTAAVEENKNIMGDTEIPHSEPVSEDLVAKSDAVTNILKEISEEFIENIKMNIESVIDESVATSDYTTVSEEENKDIMQATETSESVPVAEDLVAQPDSILNVLEKISEENAENSKVKSQPVIDDSAATSGSTTVPDEATKTPESIAGVEDLVTQSDSVTNVLEGISEEITESRKEEIQPVIDDSVATSGSTSVPVEENMDHSLVRN